MEPDETTKTVLARERRQACWICALLVASVLLIFWPVVSFEFINYDDPDYVASNSHVQKGLTWENVRWAFTTGHASNWHPFTWLSHMLDWQMFGDEPGAHHLMSVLIHAANSVLLFLALRKLTRVRSAPSMAGPKAASHFAKARAADSETASANFLWPCALVAALFALHPLHVESVAWVSERKDVLCAFFWMLTMWGYATYAELKTPNSKLKTLFYALTLLSFTFALLAKPMAVTLPFVLLLLDVWPLQRLSRKLENQTPSADVPRLSTFDFRFFLKLFLEKTPFFALIVVSSVLTFWAQKKGGAVTSLQALDLWPRVSNAIISYPRYLGKMLWPQDLAVLYPHPWKWEWWLVAVAAVFLLTATALVLWQMVKRPFLAIGWFWFLGTLVPVIGLVQVGLQSIADRYTYLPLIGIFLVIAWGAQEIFRRFPKMKSALLVSAAVILLVCAGLTFRQLQLWKNSGTLFSHAVKVTQKNFLAHNNLGYYLYNQGKVEEAISHYRQSLEIYPQFDIGWNNMGYALAGQNKFQEAIVYYRQALKLNPKHADVRNNLGNALGNVGQSAEALVEYREALKLKPDHADAHNNLGVALAQEGKFEEGLHHLREAIRLDPKKASAHSNLGNTFAVQGRFDEAIPEYKLALQINANDAQAHNNLANVFSSKNRLDEAVTHYLTALKLNTNNPEAHCNLGYVLAKQGKFSEAKTHWQEALRLRPNYPEVQRQLNALHQNVQP